MQASPPARILFGVYVVLAIYASLYPLSGWRAQGLSPFAYLASPWPRYVTAFDLAANLLGYLPFGFLCIAALRPKLQGAAAFAATLAGAGALSVALEALQSYLPTRVATNLDVLCNVGGAALGAALALAAAPRLLIEGPLRRLRAAAFLPGVGIDVGLVLLGLWLFTQLNPATLLFAAGDLRDLFSAGREEVRPGYFVAVEALTASANLVAVGLLLSVIVRREQLPHALFVALLVAALAVKTAAYAIVMHTGNVLAWMTLGAQIGLAVGVVLALALMSLPRTARLAVAATLIMAATVVVNDAPANPYFAATLKVWQQGHFLNFNGLTRLVSALWSFAAAAYLIWLAARKPESVG
jgi:VanZ family protein